MANTNTPGVTWRGLPLEAREAKIEGFFDVCAARGFAPGHELDDWLAAEAAIDRDLPPPAAEAPGPIQQSGVVGNATDEALKRLVRQDPQKAIARVEGVEPELAPPRE